MDKITKYLQSYQQLSRQLLTTTKLKKQEMKSAAFKKTSHMKDALNTSVKTKVVNSVRFVDDTLGVTEVMDAQKNVALHESMFLKSRDHVTNLKKLFDEKQDLLYETRQKLDRTDRHDESYLTYVADEHKVLLEVKKFQRDYGVAEEVEREKFDMYTSSVRLSHEKERSRAERTKYWSIIGSISGTILGFLWSSLLTQYRLSSIAQSTSTTMQQAIDTVHFELQENKAFVSKHFEEQDAKQTPSTQLSDNDSIHTLLKDFKLLTQNIQTDDKVDREVIHNLKNQLESIYKQINDNMVTTTNQLRNINNLQNELNAYVSTVKRDSHDILTNSVIPQHFDETNKSKQLHDYLSMENINTGLTLAIFSILLFDAVHRLAS